MNPSELKITKIEAQVKNRGRYSIFVNDKFEFGISENGLLNSGLRIGQTMSGDEFANLKESAKTDKIYNQVLSLIMRRPRSRWEIMEYLRRKEVAKPVSKEICLMLEEKGYISDLDFASRWVENRRLLKPTSRRKLEMELKQKRVSESVIRQVLSEDDADEAEVLKQEVERKRRQTRYQDDLKLMQYLARQGYKYDDIKQALSSDAG